MIRAIIADDEQASCAIIKNHIERHSMYIEIAGIARDGFETLCMIRDLSPDLVFLDIQMPYCDGFHVMESFPNIKYILITAYDTFDNAQHALRLGAIDILLKPINIVQLTAAIDKAFDWRITSNSIVNQILDYIHKHYQENIKLHDLANQYYITPSALSRAFHTSTGCNFLDYLHQVRIREAKKLIDCGLPIKDAAYQVGYLNLNSFYKFFKREVGLTPAEYLKRERRI